MLSRAAITCCHLGRFAVCLSMLYNAFVLVIVKCGSELPLESRFGCFSLLENRFGFLLKNISVLVPRLSIGFEQACFLVRFPTSVLVTRFSCLIK